jgi:hypothetical protein
METVLAVATSWWGIGIGVVTLGSVGVVLWRWVLAVLVFASIDLP